MNWTKISLYFISQLTECTSSSHITNMSRLFKYPTISRFMRSGIPSSIPLNSGERMPMFGISININDCPSTIKSCLASALSSGYRLLDTGFSFRNIHEAIGSVLKDVISTEKLRREELFICETISILDVQNSEDIIRKSLEMLKLDYVNLIRLYWPLSTKNELTGVYDTSLEDTLENTNDLSYCWEILEDLKNKKLCNSLGLTNFSLSKIVDIYDSAEYKPDIIQVDVQPYEPRNLMHQICDDMGIVLSSYIELGPSLFPKDVYCIFGCKFPIIPALLEDPRIIQIAWYHGKSPEQVVYRYLLQRGIPHAPRCTNPSSIKANLQVFDFNLSEDEMIVIASMENGMSYTKNGYF